MILVKFSIKETAIFDYFRKRIVYLQEIIFSGFSVSGILTEKELFALTKA